MLHILRIFWKIKNYVINLINNERDRREGAKINKKQENDIITTL